MLFQIRYAEDIWRTEKVDWPFVMPASASASLEIVRPEAEKLGLHTGDTLLAVNGQKYTGTALLSEAYAKARPGDQFELRVKSASGEHSVVLPLTAGTTPLSQVIFDVLLNIVAPIGCVLLGSWVVLIRPRDRLAWILLGLMFCFSQMFSSFKIESWGPGYQNWPWLTVRLSRSGGLFSCSCSASSSRNRFRSTRGWERGGSGSRHW
jgi:hypothetical protein